MTKAKSSPAKRGFFGRNWKLIVGLLISAFFLYWFLRMCKFREMWDAFKTIDYSFVLLTLVSIFASYFARGVRWTFLLRPVKQVSIGASFSATIIGFTASNVLPMRAGEFIRAYVLAKSENVRATATFATIVVERLCDGFCVLAILVIALSLFSSVLSSTAEVQASEIQKVLELATPRTFMILALLSLALYVSIVVILVLLKMAPKKTERIIERVLFFAPQPLVHKVIDTLRSFSDGIASINSIRQAINVFFWSLLTWGSILMGPWLLSRAFGLKLGIHMGFFVTAVLALGVMLPSSPGFIGIFQFSTAAAMILLGVEEQIATTYGLVLWVLSIIPVTILGFILCWVGKTSFLQIVKATKEERIGTSEDAGA